MSNSRNKDLLDLFEDLLFKLFKHFNPSLGNENCIRFRVENILQFPVVIKTKFTGGKLEQFVQVLVDQTLYSKEEKC